MPVEPQVDECPAHKAHVEEVLLVRPRVPEAVTFGPQGHGLKEGEKKEEQIKVGEKEVQNSPKSSLAPPLNKLH